MERVGCTLDGDNLNLGTLHTTYEKSDDKNSLTAGEWNTFTFTNTFAISNGTSYAIVVTMNKVDGTNYYFVHDASDAGDDWKISKSGEFSCWENDGSHNHTWTGYNMTFKIYGTE